MYVRFALLGTGLLVGVLAAVLCRAPEDARPARPTVRVEAIPPERVASLESENALLRERLDRLELRLVQAPELAAAAPELAPPPLAPERADPMASPPSEEELEAIREERLVTLEDQLLREARQPSRALELEESIREGLAEAALEGDALAGLECGETLCRTEFDFADDASRDEAMRLVPHLIPWDAEGYGSADPENPLRIVLYISQAEADLPATN